VASSSESCSDKPEILKGDDVEDSRQDKAAKFEWRAVRVFPESILNDDYS